MFPSKNTMDYMGEMNRLFSRNNEFDIHSPMTSSSSQSFSHSIIPSSSSPETSPESYPETNQRVPEVFQQNYQRIDERPEYFEQRRERFAQRPQYFEQRLEFSDRRPEFVDRRQEECVQQDFCETPFIIRRQRPIIGRKIMTATETPPKIEMDKFWSPNEFVQQTPPKSNSYELFPMGNKGFEIRTPVKTPPTFTSSPISPISNMTMSPIPISPQSPKLIQKLIPMSPIVSPNSPKLVPNSPKMIPVITKSSFPQRFLFQDKPCTSQNTQNFPVKMCTFCRKNGETPLVYMAHAVKEKVGNKNIVTCPILRRHVCQTCGASGDNAHTITYCPVLRSSNNGQPLRSTTITLKNTRVKSNGRRRF